MPVVTRLRSTPSMEKLWEAAERQEEERLKQEVEKDKLAKKQQRHQDTLQLSKIKKKNLEKAKTNKSKLQVSKAVPPPSNKKPQVGCWDALYHCLKYFVIFLISGLSIIFGGNEIYEFIVGYEMTHQRLSIILTGDPGSHGVESEGFYLEQYLKHKEVELLSDSLCDSIVHGWLHGHRVILVSTGIGHDSASVCVTSLLSKWGTMTKEVIFMGTSGFSPARGGILNSDHCGAANQSPELTMVGDVCVTQMSTNWDYQTCTFPDSVNSACYAAECSRQPLHHHQFGQLESGFYADPTLALEVMSAMQDVQLPPQPPVIQKFSEDYWKAMSDGTHQKYESRPNPKLFDHTQCGEASSDLIWEGVPFDEVARKYIASEMNWGGGVGGNVSKREVIAVSATEGIGWMGALYYFEKELRRTKIPSVNIRGAANHVHAPVVRTSTASVGKEDVRWLYDSEWLLRDDIDEYMSASYNYAVNTTSHVVLSLFKARENYNSHL